MTIKSCSVEANFLAKELFSATLTMFSRFDLSSRMFAL